MKKLVSILAIAAAMTACNSNSENKEAGADSTKTENPVMDAVNTADSAGKVMEAGKDSAAAMMMQVKDSAVKK